MRFSAFETYADRSGISSPISPEPQNSDYESGMVEIDGESWHIRTARTTPTKPGAFVAFWRRDEKAKTVPYGSDDPAAGLLVFVEQGGRRGVFRFPTEYLAELGVTSAGSAGKRGFRLYPSWCEGLNPQAAATQRAQASAFREY